MTDLVDPEALADRLLGAYASGVTSGKTPEEVFDAYRARTSLGHLPSPEDVAWLVDCLLAPQARLLHGAVIGADAGARHHIL